MSNCAKTEYDMKTENGIRLYSIHNGALTSEIQAAHDQTPSVRIPGPAGDDVVDQCAPDEGEDDHWHDSSSLRRCSQCQRWCYGGEHALINGEKESRDGWSRFRLVEHVHEKGVVQVADEGVTSMAEG